MLSKEQIEQFDRDGFLLVRGMYNAAEMDEINRRTVTDSRNTRMYRPAGMITPACISRR